MHIEVSAGALVKALGIVDNWPATNRGTLALLDRLAETLALMPEEKEAIHWRAIRDADGLTRAYAYQPDVMLEREISEPDAAALRGLLGPNEHAPWLRTERATYNEWMQQLGGDPW